MTQMENKMTTKKKLAVILSGCGHQDGAEIHESTLTLLAIHKLGADFQCFAPDKNQFHVINHISGEELQETRNVLIESARIARGDILDLATYMVDKYDALILPGGFGAAKNLSTFAFDGPNCEVDQTVKDAILLTHQAKKPIGALCIAPVILAKLLNNATVTIGTNVEVAEGIAAMGGKHTTTSHGEITIDRENLLVTTPCYMLDSRIDHIADGAENLVKEILAMA